MKKFRNGFTLAEVLITLGIVGIVAEITIPVLMQNVQDAQFYSATKKVASVLTQATVQMVSDNSGQIWDNSSVVGSVLSKSMADGYAPYLKTLNEAICNQIQTNSVAYYKTPSSLLAPSTAQTCLLLKDGAIMRMVSRSQCGISLPGGLGYDCGGIFVDVNGNKPPNMWGRDVQRFIVIKTNSGNYRVAPSGPDIDGLTCASGDGSGCAEYIIEGQALP